jgi:hypothetical protein
MIGEGNKSSALCEANQAFAVSALLALKGSNNEDSTTKTHRCPISATPLKQNGTQFPIPTTPLKQNDTLTQKHKHVAKRIKKSEKTTMTKTRKMPKVIRNRFCKLIIESEQREMKLIMERYERIRNPLCSWRTYCLESKRTESK